jgi:hypothetical protein
MNTFIRNSLAVVVGLVLGGAVNMLIITIGPGIIAPPAGVDATDAESIAASMHLYEPKHFITPLVAHAVGTLVGALLAFLVAASHKSLFAFVIGLAFLAGGTYMVFTLPGPVWFSVLDLTVAYLPMAWLGILIGRRMTGSNG